MAKNHAQKSLLISSALYSTIALFSITIFSKTEEPMQKVTSVALSSFQEEKREQPQNNQVPKSLPKQTAPQKTYAEKKQPEQQSKPTDVHTQNSIPKEESTVKNENVTIPVKQPVREPINIEKEYLKINKVKIREAIAKHQRYPASAIKMDYEGTCTVRFKLHPTGRVEGIKVVESSGFVAIDKSAVQAVDDAASEMPKPNESVTLTIPIGYTLH